MISFFYLTLKLKQWIELLGKVDFCTDISDGIYSELSRVSERSNLESVIFLDQIPLSSRLIWILKNNNFDKIYNIILGGGEDYQLLFSSKSLESKKLQNQKDFTKLDISEMEKALKL